jgi:hypothetical protein
MQEVGVKLSHWMPWKNIRGGGGYIYLSSFLTLTSDESVIHAPATLTRGERAVGAHWLGGWMGPSVGLEAWESRNVSCPFCEWGSNSSMVELVSHRTTAAPPHWLYNHEVTYGN